MTKTISATTVPRTLVIPASAEIAWRDPEFHVIATNVVEEFETFRSPTDSQGRRLHAMSVDRGLHQLHPVHIASVGDIWSFWLDGERTADYEYIGRFRLIAEFVDADTNWKNYIVREVTN